MEAELRALVLRHMIHRQKRYPKPFSEGTTISPTGYTQLKRPDDGTIDVLEDGKTVVTNRDVVPYNRYFLKKFEAHINVEHYASIEAIKYIFKYVFKGYDCAKMEPVTKVANNIATEDILGPVVPEVDDVQDIGTVSRNMKPVEDVSGRNETNLVQAEVSAGDEEAETNAVGTQLHYKNLPPENINDGPCEVKMDVIDYDEVSWSRRIRVLTASEAIYRDCGYLMHKLSHTIIRLAVHLPDEKVVYIQEGEEVPALSRSVRKRTQLEAYFELNKKDENARKLTFLEMAKEYR